jgi:tetratricopeptide (TPR) repeat protein
MMLDRTQMITISIVLILAGALLWAAPRISRAQSAASGLLEQANEAYEEGRYDEAVDVYEQILATGVIHGTVLYNLGNAYFKMDRLGPAILMYQRARWLLPRDQDVAANLRLARQLTIDKTLQENPPLLIRWITYPARTLSENELTWLSSILYISTACLVVIGIWIRPDRLRKKILVSALVGGILLIVVGGSLAGKIYWRTSMIRAVVLAPAVDARSGPGDDYTKIFTAHEGTTVKIRQQREGWYLIALPNGLGGWIPDTSAEIIQWRHSVSDKPFTEGGSDVQMARSADLDPDDLDRSVRSGLQGGKD